MRESERGGGGRRESERDEEERGEVGEVSCGKVESEDQCSNSATELPRQAQAAHWYVRTYTYLRVSSCKERVRNSLIISPLVRGEVWGSEVTSEGVRDVKLVLRLVAECCVLCEG